MAKTIGDPKGRKIVNDNKTYIENCAKMCKYRVNIADATILAPQSHEDKWKECLAAEHLINKFGFHIQFTIDDSVNGDVFDPELNLKNHRPIPKEKPQEGFKVGDKFEIVSSGDRLEIKSNINGLRLHYLNIGKGDINTTIVALQKMLDLGTWQRIK